jgi:uncharacterized membrane protein
MSFDSLVQAAQNYFPSLRIRYKNESWLMKIIGAILFFNKGFMTDYITTIGSTVYFPSREFVANHAASADIILLHELIHIHDAQRLTRLLFSILYLFPQILALMFFPLLLISWKLALPFLLFLLPVPAYFRMQFEKRAYLTSLYALKRLSKRLVFLPLLKSQEILFIDQFVGAGYYWMWPFRDGLQKEFDAAIDRVNSDQRPFDDKIFDVLDQLMLQV